MMRVLAGTGNGNKIREFSEILSGTGVCIVSPGDIGVVLPDVDETGSTFEENAALKAMFYAKFANMAALSDDSGLEVEALCNAPGIMSSRYASDDRSRIGRVLKELSDCEIRSGKVNRRARFVCVVALATPEGLFGSFRGEVYGNICDSARGSGGFGYDPVFVPDGHLETFGELPSSVKGQISHRACALRKAAEFLRKEDWRCV